jgi:magnesium transporter
MPPNAPGDPQVLIDELRAALRLSTEEERDAALRAALAGAHPADIALAMEELTYPEALAVFVRLDEARAAEALDELANDQELLRYLIANSGPGRIAALLDRLPMDDAAEVVADASPEQAAALLTDLTARAPADAAEVRELLSYGERTAGRLITDKFVRLDPAMTVEEAFAAVRHADPEVETLTDLFVVERVPVNGREEERLLGVLSLRELVRARPEQTIGEVMVRDLITVSVDTDQEEVAQLISRYDLLALPVLDRNGFLAGIITVDDVVDILVEEQTEDVLKLGAVAATEVPYMATGVLATVRQRFGWLLLLFVAETATGTVLRHFEDELARVVALAFFVPLLIGTGGNAGAQTVTTITRALALGEIRFRDLARVLWREMRTGVILGAALGAVGFGRALLWHTGMGLAGVVALSMTLIVVWAVTVGAVLPITFKRLGWDPAVMSAPFITTLVDATGLFLYFKLADALLGI